VSARLALAVVAVLAMSGCAAAGEFGSPNRPKREWPPGPNSEFLKNLVRPDNHEHPYRDKRSLSCCDAGDTVQTQYRVEIGDGFYPEDSWFALIEGKWERIPPDKIVPDYAPDGRPYLFLLAGTIQCFVRPRGGL
jgi:hypothetical protein